jgi:hypothetical protein
MKRNTIKIVHEGRYAAEIPVELIEGEGGWSPYLSVKEATKLDLVTDGVARGRRHNRREAWPSFRVAAGLDLKCLRSSLRLRLLSVSTASAP